MVFHLKYIRYLCRGWLMVDFRSFVKRMTDWLKFVMKKPLKLNWLIFGWNLPIFWVFRSKVGWNCHFFKQNLWKWTNEMSFWDDDLSQQMNMMFLKRDVMDIIILSLPNKFKQIQRLLLETRMEGEKCEVTEERRMDDDVCVFFHEMMIWDIKQIVCNLWLKHY